jgi:hypothetical protein
MADFIKKGAMGLAVALGLCVFPIPAKADITELQPLRFGEWIVTNNDTVQTVTVNTDGSYNNSAGLIMLQAPQQGIYRIDGLPPFAIIMGFDIVMTEPMTGAGNSFTMDSFQTTADPVDGSGETTLSLGATARSSGNGQPYPDTTYNGELTIDIDM